MARTVKNSKINTVPCNALPKKVVRTLRDKIRDRALERLEVLQAEREVVREEVRAEEVKEEIKRYANGFKGEAKESKEAFLILEKYMRKEEVSDEENKFFKDQIIDILKGVGVVLPIQLIQANWPYT